jgi:hypothetical protein
MQQEGPGFGVAAIAQEGAGRGTGGTGRRTDGYGACFSIARHRGKMEGKVGKFHGMKGRKGKKERKKGKESNRARIGPGMRQFCSGQNVYVGVGKDGRPIIKTTIRRIFSGCSFKNG